MARNHRVGYPACMDLNKVTFDTRSLGAGPTRAVSLTRRRHPERPRFHKRAEGSRVGLPERADTPRRIPRSAKKSAPLGRTRVPDVRIAFPFPPVYKGRIVRGSWEPFPWAPFSF